VSDWPFFPFTQSLIAQLTTIGKTDNSSIPQQAAAELQFIGSIAPLQALLPLYCPFAGFIAPLQNIKSSSPDKHRTFRMFFGRFARFSDV
jgi:hypothetical protein